MNTIKWKKICSLAFGCTFLVAPCAESVESEELTSATYTTGMGSISTGGTYTVSQGDVIRDASGYTGHSSGQRPLANTVNGDIDFIIDPGRTLTFRGFNNNQGTSERTTLYAYERGGPYGGRMSFTGGNVIVSNESNTGNSYIYALFAGPGGKFDFKSDGDNKINLSVLMPMVGPARADRHGIGLYQGQFGFDGGRFRIEIEGDPEDDGLSHREGLAVSAGSTVDIKADLIEVDVSEVAMLLSASLDSSNYPVVNNVMNRVNFEADYISIKSGQIGLWGGGNLDANGVSSQIEFTGQTKIEALSRGDVDIYYGEIVGGRAIELLSTDITFNGVTEVVGENLTLLGTRPGYDHEFLGWQDGYWLRTITIMDHSRLTTNDDFIITSNGGYYNTGFYLWESEAYFNGKVRINMLNGGDTTRAVYSIGTTEDTTPTRAEFRDDVIISLAGSDARYVSGMEAAGGGVIEVQKGLQITDNDNATWSLFSREENSLIDVNTSGTGTIQLKGNIGAINDATLNMVLNNEDSWVTAASYTETNFDTTPGTVNLALTNGSVWNMTDSSHVTNLTMDNSTVNFLPPGHAGNFKTLTVEGNFNGGGTLNMSTKLGGDNSPTDKLVVEGDTSGDTLVAVTNAGGAGATAANGIELVEVLGNSAGTFEKVDRIVAGIYEYDLVKRGKNWYLTNNIVVEPEPGPEPVPADTPPVEPTAPGGGQQYRPEPGIYLANALVANTLFTTTMHDRLGKAQYTDMLTGQQKSTSLWMRHTGGHTRFKDTSGQLSTQSNRYIVQLGGDVAQWSTNGVNRWHLGLMAGYATSSSHTHSNLTGYSSRGQIHGYSAGIYGTWHANDIDKTGAWVDSWLLYNWFDNDVSGDYLETEKYKSDGITASLETGYNFRVAGSSDARTSYWLQPKVQAIWMNVRADDHTEKNGTRVVDNSEGNLQTRVGVKAYLQSYNKMDEGKDRSFLPFVEANWIHNTNQFRLKMDGVSNEISGTRNYGELKVGVESQINQNLHLWGNISQQIGNNGYSDTQGILGVKYTF
ncbi:autotransporter outer membrane beta-barrel domain-containing protein [Citrobacter farmeri]|uniref:autotransporter outer membrane beta-barrel domain-containing protein n=1 Tax=Citrobacter amalonaticus TaxID=35703 RepID=UPI000B19BB51|nr:autotransporter outer membrane beta-barrel domain-containing protein [Citrobacter amalonaticus]